MCGLHEQGQYVDYEINKRFVWYHWNWYQELHWIECTNVDITVQAMMGVYLLTNGVSGMYVGWIPDFYGRKTTIVRSLGASLLIQLVFMFDKSHLMRYICFFALALCNVKNGCSYVWAYEQSGAKNKMFVTVVMNAFDRVTLFVMGFFLIFLTRWWMVIVGTYWLAGALALYIAYYYIPESPLWLVMNNRNEEAIANLNQIAKTNGVKERIAERTEFTEMQVTANVQEDAASFHTIMSSVAGDLSAASFAIQA